MATCESLAQDCNASLVYQGVNGMRIWYYGGKNPLAIIQRSAKAVNVKRGDHLVFSSPERREVWAKEQMDKAQAMARRRSEAKCANLEHRTIKGVATRATVRVVAADGEAERSMRCDSGLSIRQMHAAIASFDGAVDALRNRTSVPKYIMFEIQRGPNDC